MKLSSALFFFSLIGASLVRAATDAPPSAPAAATPSPYQEGLFTIIQVERPEFPTRMLVEGVKRGRVILQIEVDKQGQLADHLLVAYTHKPFADEVVQAVKTWRFNPTREDGKPLATIAEITVEFHQEGVSVIQSNATTRAYLDMEYDYAPTPVDELDHPPRVVRRVNPTYPEQLLEQGLVGRVPVSYFVDQEGRVRMPIASSLEDSYLAGLAIAAVKQWEYEPPTVRGNPVMTRVTTSFIFGETDVAASGR